jgi:spore maturation protein CgeB
MRVLVAGPEYYNYSDSVAWAVGELGHQVAQCNFATFGPGQSYLVRKLHKWGCRGFERAHLRRWEETFLQACDAFRPDCCLVINGNWIRRPLLERVKASGVQLRLWMIDSISRMPESEESLGCYDARFSFDHRDGPYILEKHGLSCPYCPVGYDPRIYRPGEQVDRDIDISFVGVPVRYRLGILREVAAHARHRGYRLAAFGDYWDPRYFWKRRRFDRRPPFLQAFVHNHCLAPAEAAAVYRRSRICLNIHIPDHEGVNPRTFEILGTRSFQLTDRKPMLDRLLTDGTDLVVYEDVQDLLGKIDHYLHAEQERERIASAGHRRASEDYTILASVRALFA